MFRINKHQMEMVATYTGKDQETDELAFTLLVFPSHDDNKYMWIIVSEEGLYSAGLANSEAEAVEDANRFFIVGNLEQPDAWGRNTEWGVIH